MANRGSGELPLWARTGVNQPEQAAEPEVKPAEVAAKVSEDEPAWARSGFQHPDQKPAGNVATLTADEPVPAPMAFCAEETESAEEEQADKPLPSFDLHQSTNNLGAQLAASAAEAAEAYIETDSSNEDQDVLNSPEKQPEPRQDFGRKSLTSSYFKEKKTTEDVNCYF